MPVRWRKRWRKFDAMRRDLGWAATLRHLRNRCSREPIVSLRLRDYPVPVYYRRHNRTDLNLLRKILCGGAGDPGLALADGLIIDGGANAGYVTLALARRYPRCRIVAVEPDAGNCELLRLNSAALPQVRVLQAALWSESGTLGITNPGAKSVSYRVSADGAGASVPACTIADVMAQAGAATISLLKLDIEGAEYELLRNGWEAWFPRVRALMVELHESLAPGLEALFAERLATRPHRRSRHGEYDLVLFTDTAADAGSAGAGPSRA